MFKRVSVIMISIFVATSLSVPAVAAESPFKSVFEDALYGGLAGTLVGAAFMALTKSPEDHINNVVYGAAAGVLVGTGYGMVSATKALAKVENGRIEFAVPTVVPDFQSVSGKGQLALMLKADLLRCTF